jgi:transcriptional regulator with XRE-family HTH domain
MRVNRESVHRYYRCDIVHAVQTNGTLVGGRLRQLRVSAHVTQEWVAERLGVHVRTLQSYERGETQINADSLPQVAAIFDVAPTVFYESLTDFEDHCAELYLRFLRRDTDNRAIAEAAAYVQTIMFGGISPFRQPAEEPLEPAMTG